MTRVLDLMSISSSIILIFTIIVVCVSWKLMTRKKLPPGPWGFPLVGYLPNMVFNLYRTGDEPEKLLAKIASRYGEIFSMNFGTQTIVVVSGHKSIKEAFQNPFMNDRPTSTLFEETALSKGIILAAGGWWKYQRKFTSSTFRNMGVGKNDFANQLIAEAETMVQAMFQINGRPFDPKILIGNCVSNVICSVVWGERFDHSDPKFEHLLNMLSTLVNKAGSGGAVMFLPVMRYVVPQRYNDLKSLLLEFRAFVKNVVDEHVERFSEDNLNDFIDVYLNEIERCKKHTSDRCDYIQTESLLASSVVLFFAGTDTATAVLRWALLYMVEYPEIMAKVQEEIDAISTKNAPQWADRSALPYTQAVLHEIMRIRTILPLSLPHVATKDTSLAGYAISRGSIIVSNLWAAHNDAAVWPEPDLFKPERFLDENGKFRSREELIPFSEGHRICLGEQLAKMELFIFFTYIMQKFNIKKAHPGQVYSFHGISGLSFSPQPFEIVTEHRKH